MKRVGISLLISIALMIVWTITAGLLLGFVFVDSEDVASLMATPLRLPDLFMDHVLALELDYERDFGLWLSLTAVCNIVLYAIPIYGILTILGRFKQKPITSTEPPPPPSFDD